MPLSECVQQCLFTAEVLIESADGVPGPFGNPVGGRAQPLALENLSSGFEQHRNGVLGTLLPGGFPRSVDDGSNASCPAGSKARRIGPWPILTWHLLATSIEPAWPADHDRDPRRRTEHSGRLRTARPSRPCAPGHVFLV